MATARKWLALVSLIGIIIGVGFLVVRTYTRAETIIEGKPLSAWVRELGNPNFNAPDLSAFGVNARKSLPTLMEFIPANFSATNFLRISPMLRAIAQIGPGPYSPQVMRAATNLLSSVERGNIDTALIALG